MCVNVASRRQAICNLRTTDSQNAHSGIVFLHIPKLRTYSSKRVFSLVICQRSQHSLAARHGFRESELTGNAENPEQQAGAHSGGGDGAGHRYAARRRHYG